MNKLLVLIASLILVSCATVSKEAEEVKDFGIEVIKWKIITKTI